MAPPDLKTLLAAGETVFGSWLSFAFPPVAEMFARAGFDFLVIDMEHAAIGPAESLALIQVIELAGTAPLVRVAANQPHLIKQSLDSGATGVVVPMVNSPEDAERAVRAAHYPPRGDRGAGLFRAQSYGADFAGYKARADAGTVVVVQIEHHEAVRNLRDILDVPGVDAFIVGPYDLSGSLGRPGDFEHAEVRGMIDEIERIVAESNVPGGFHVVHSDKSELEARIAAGYRFLAYGDDMVFLTEKLAAEVGLAAALLERRVQQ